MRRISLSLIATVILMMGCATRRADRDFDSPYFWRDHSRVRADVPADVLCADAVDLSATRYNRCLAIFQIFGTFIKPGFTSQQMRATVPDTRWLEFCSLGYVGGVGGYIPVRWSSSVFILRPLPDKDGWSEWVIYFRLSDEPKKHSRTRDDALAFLKGTHPDSSVRLAEFALCYPLRPVTRQGARITERFTKRGVGLSVQEGFGPSVQE